MGNTEAGENSNNARKAGFQITKEPVVHGAVEKRAASPEPWQEELSPFEDLGNLPVTYGSRSLFLVARDPRWLFTYWDIDWSEFPSGCIPGGKIFLKVYDADGEEVYQSEVTPEARNWSIPVSKGNALFYGEIGFFQPTANGNEWEAIARSNETTTPSDTVSGETRDVFATVPYHLAFQRMLDLVQTAMTEGESLLGALSRIQNEGRQHIAALNASPSWSDDQRRVLASLLGNEVSALMELTAEEIDQMLRSQLNNLISSGGISSRSGGAEGAFSSGAFSSGIFPGGDRSALSSWLSSWGGAGESAFWSSYLSSWGGMGGASGGESSALSSWLSSWPGGGAKAGNAESGENAFWSSWLSSWSGGVGGLGGASGAFGSREFGSSWSAQPFGQFGESRDFFMHVNAEVIFYGGAKPGSKVWIGGKPVPLDAGGGFRFHFKFPDGDTTIPIVAESPDGSEQRSATLRFQRGTERQGEVGSSAQPPELSDLR